MPYDTFTATDSLSIEEDSSKNSLRLSVIRGLIFFSVIVATLLVFATYTFSKIITVHRLSSSETASFNWVFEKHTASISAGSYESVTEFVNNYITNVYKVSNLGCYETFRIVGLCVNNYEVHWVDSAVFPQSGRTIAEWSETMKGFGIENHNDFMHNKLQLYVPSLQGHFNTISSADDVDAVYRLSTSPGSSEIDTAHISVFLWDAQTVYEIVGPKSSLSDEALESFSEWSDAECVEAHVLPLSLSTYSVAYDDYLENNNVTASWKWSTQKGMSIPMVVQTSMPASSFDAVAGSMTMMQDLTGIDFSYSTSNDGKCNVATYTLTGQLSPTVKFVVNNGNTETTPSIADWETEVVASHDEYLNAGGDNGWDRYLDSHFGFAVSAGDYCDTATSDIVDELAKVDFKYAYRVTPGGGGPAHYYIGTDGVRSWEINARDCFVYEVTDICGCDSSNNAITYRNDYSCYDLASVIFTE